MARALELARDAAERGEVPVGAVLVDASGKWLAEGANAIEANNDPTAHAERLVLTEACRRVGHTRLPEGSLLAVTLEPCAMCAGALVLARADFLVFGATDPKAGACGSLRNIITDARLNHRATILDSVLADPCGEVLTSFFRARRGRATG